MASHGQHSYILDAFGLIALFAIAMIGISVPFQMLNISKHQNTQGTVLSAQQSK